MTTFLVTTIETVEGIYEVEADDIGDVITRITSLPRDWQGITQVDYQAFDVKVDGMKEVRDDR